MSRKIVLFLSAIIMAMLALVVALVFREPLAPEVVAAAGDSVSGPIQTEPVQSLTPPLPPAEAMVMSSGDALPVTSVEPGPKAEPAGVASLVRDAPAGSAPVTEPPAARPASAGALAGVRPGPASSASPQLSAAPAEAPKKKDNGGEIVLPAGPASSAGTAAAPGGAPAPSPAPQDKPVAASSRPGEAVPSLKPSALPPAAERGADTPLKPGTLVTKSALPAKAGSQVITAATLTMDGDVVTLRLQGNAPLKGRTFLLTGPDRAVLDLEGDWKVEAPRVPSNRMVRSLRVGAQDKTTRLVFDMKVKPLKAAVANPDDRTLEFSIR